jgi:uncharacterized membrane protein
MGSLIDLIIELSYQLEGGTEEQPIQHTQPVAWPIPSGPALSITSFDVDPPNLSLSCGEQAKLTLGIKNPGNVSLPITLSIAGLPETWVVMTPPAWDLPPGEQKTPPIVITVPEDRAQAFAGVYHTTIPAVSINSQSPEPKPVTMKVKLKRSRDAYALQ